MKFGKHIGVVCLRTTAYLFIVSVCWLVFLNRGSEKVVTAFAAAITAIVLAAMFSKEQPPVAGLWKKAEFWLTREKTLVTGVLACQTVLLSIFIFAEQPSVSNSFPAMLCYELKDRSYVQLSSYHDRAYDYGFYVQQLKQARPDLFKDSDVKNIDESGQLLYHQFLQYEIARALGMEFHASWVPEVVDGGIVKMIGGTAPSLVYSPDEIERLMRGNPFASMKLGIPMQISLPPGARLSFVVPFHSEVGMDFGEIHIDKPHYFSLSIRTQSLGAIRGSDVYRWMTPITNERDFARSSERFAVTVKCEFTKWLAGNPDMPRYDDWVDHLVSILQKRFDENEIERQTRDSLMFQKLMSLR